MNSTSNANQDIEEKNKNKRLPAAAHAVDFTIKRLARSHPKRASRLVDSNDDEQSIDQIVNGNTNGAPAHMNHEDGQNGAGDVLKKANGVDFLSHINCYATNHQRHLMENNSKTKCGLGHYVDTGNALQRAPTTVESKDILQQHQQLQQLLSIGSDKPHQTNLGLITPNLESSTLKTLNTTNNIRDLINQQSQLNSNGGNHQIFNSIQMQKDLGLGISAAANSILKKTNIMN